MESSSAALLSILRPAPWAARMAQPAMAGFGGGGGAAENLNTVALSADASQQTLLTTPQHA
jgi:hypothetical protein